MKGTLVGFFWLFGRGPPSLAPCSFDNLNVVRAEGLSFALMDNLIFVIAQLSRGIGTVQIVMVKPQASGNLVDICQVRMSATFGNDQADLAADFGRRRQLTLVTDCSES